MKLGLFSWLRWIGVGLILVGMVVIFMVIAHSTSVVHAAVTDQFPLSRSAVQDNEDCLACHANPNQYFTFPNGVRISVTIDPKAFELSAHGAAGHRCTTCHPAATKYPHPYPDALNHKEYTLAYDKVCQNCHPDQYENNLDGVHYKALSSGDRRAPFCTDCHDPHTQPRVRDEQGNISNEVKVLIANTCAKCHSVIFNTYAESVHGFNLLIKQNGDVPTCIDCHGVHGIQDPTTAAFRLSSVELCAKCHTNPAIMDKYGISTNVLRTYVADFHGTTTVLFTQKEPNQAPNTPVCYDCHGIHDIARSEDPQKGLKIQQNLLKTCQKCHPEATLNFPASWMSHYVPDPEKTPLVYYVQLFYKFFVPMVIGGMAIFVTSDIVRRQIDKRKKPLHSSEETREDIQPEHPSETQHQEE